VAGLEDAHVGCCSRSPGTASAAAASPGCAELQRGTGGGGGRREEEEEEEERGGGEADDVNSFKSFRSPLHRHVTADAVYYSSGLFPGHATRRRADRTP